MNQTWLSNIGIVCIAAVSALQSSCRHDVRADERESSAAAAAPPEPGRPHSETDALVAALVAGYGDAAAERAAILKAAGPPIPCSVDWCRDATLLMAAWSQTVEGTVPGVTISPPLCSALGSWSDLTAADLGSMVTASGVVKRQAGWRGVSLVGGPDMSQVPSVRSHLMLVKPPEEETSR